MPASAAAKSSLGAPAFGVIILLLLGFAFSDEVVTAVLDAFGRDDSAAQVIVIAADAAILLAVGVLKRAIDRIDGGAPGRRCCWHWPPVWCWCPPSTRTR